MVLILGLIARGIGSLVKDSHKEHPNDYPHQEPYNQNGHPTLHTNQHTGHYHYGQMQAVNRGSCCGGRFLPSKRQSRAERRVQRHYRRAERDMQRADHRLQRDLRKVERRGQLLSLPAPADSPMQQAPFNSHGYSRESNGYGMRDMGYQQQQAVHTPQLESREMGLGAVPQRQRQQGEAPPPAYEEVEKKQ
ncbi:hypothetical protein B0J13DRAFT_546181 [Dactylonectria estremocensis]|uniref:Uncharacterized protein n=1 Tax=Dactylonectria estremocensis TaxID=1079267 RepID=A0A9P9JCL8_9HYPO|nr:hypothetical protein B0J13DRAFT_546181 [Dactylonectria estremocensis]